MTFTKQVIEHARQAGADLVGIAPIGRFAGVPAGRHPQSIFPEAQSVVVLGKRVVRGCLRGVEEGTQFSLYAQFAGNWVPDRFLALTTVSTATFLEDNRWEAVPLPDLPAEAPPMGVPVRKGSPGPNVLLDVEDAAVRAGLGQFGYSGAFMTPEFGPRQRLQIILTDAPLDASPLCANPVCDRCGKCVEACPLSALSSAEEETRAICGLEMPVARIDWALCNGCRNGARPNPKHPAGRPDRGAALCIRTCVHHLGEARLETKPPNEPFRRRPAWQIGTSGTPSLREEA